MSKTPALGVLVVVLSVVSGWAAAPLVRSSFSATFTAQHPEQRWSVPIKDTDGHVLYVLSLEPAFDVDGHVVTVELVMRRAGAKPDSPNLLRGNLHLLQPIDFAASDLAHGVKNSAFGEKRTLSLPQFGLVLRIAVTGATVSLGSVAGYQLESLNLQIEVDAA